MGMDTLNILILGVVQGLTEFLPVSSSGHLVLARLALHLPNVGETSTDAFLHLGTLLAVLTYYWKVWWGILRGLFVRDPEGDDKRQLFGKLIVATIPGAIAGYLWADAIDAYFRSASSVAIGFVLTAIAFFAAEYWSRHQSQERHRAGWKEAIITGFAQVIALAPGVSRSGMTIAAGQAQGLSRSQATNFSFLMSAPIIAGAGVATLPKLLADHHHSAAALFVGFLAAFTAGLLTIHFLLSFVRKGSFIPFAIYLLVMAAIVIVLF